MSSRTADGYTEIELKFDVGVDTAVPDLTGIASVTAVSAPESTRPISTYFDTPDLALARRRITVRRRTGSHDAGWHVKMPVSADERVEHRSPLSTGGSNTRVPAEVAETVRAYTRASALIPVATIDTHRVVTVLSTADHERSVELCDDEVSARNLLDDVTVRWREWEVELLDGDRSVLRTVSKYLLRHGAAPGSSPSKLATALGPRLPAVAGRADTRSAGSAVRAALAVDVDALLAADPRVRADEDDSVHAMRVATRRLRSVLQSYGSLLDPAAVERLRSELGWLAAILGTARDAEVLAARYRSAIESLPADAVRGPVVDSLVGTQRRLYTLAHEEIVRELDGDRYFALLDALDAILVSTPVGPADEKATRVFRRVLRTRYRKVRRAARHAAALDGTEREEALHDVRKSAKKLRYAAEAAAAVLPKGRVRGAASSVATASKKVQSVLGDHQDSAVSRETVLLEAASAAERGEDTFTFGVLYAREGEDARVALAPYPDAWKRLRRSATPFTGS